MNKLAQECLSDSDKFPMLEKHRHYLIKSILEQETFSSIRHLTEKLNTSTSTIQRDINKMSKRGEITKIRGGAGLNDCDIQIKKATHAACDFDNTERNETIKLIAKRAVELCKNGDSIIIHGGNVTYPMTEYLANLNLKILTNSLSLAKNIIENSESQVTLTGGEIYREQGIILSAYEKDSTEYYRGTMVFMGCSGLGKFGVMETDPVLNRSGQKLKNQAEKFVLLADSSKVGKLIDFVFCPLSEVDILITDSKVDQAQIKYFESHGIEVIIAEVA